MEAFEHGKVLVRGTAGSLAQSISAGGHTLRADEPVEKGGSETGPDPYDLLLASLGACTSMTLRLYADQKSWPLQNVEVSLKHSKIHAQDCADCEGQEGKLDLIERQIRLDGDLSEEQRQRLLQIADRCPVHRTLTSTIHIRTRLE